jgi:hypothetical protein
VLSKTYRKPGLRQAKNQRALKNDASMALIKKAAPF